MLVSRGHGVWIAVCATVSLYGCQGHGLEASPASSPAGQMKSIDRLESVEVAGLERTYWLHLPASYDSTRPVPLVLVLHGGGGTAKRIAQYTGFSASADVEGFVVVYPEAVERHWNDGRATAGASRADDVRFISKLIDQMLGLLNIDRKRVYVAGISNGGILAQRLGCELSGKIAGIACVAGTLPKDMADKCTPTQPVSVLMIHGTADEFVPYGGGRVRGPVDGYVLSVQGTVDRWLTADGCTERSPVVTALPAEGAEGLRVRCESYGACNGGSAVVLYTVEGGGHTWPGGQMPGPLAQRVLGPTSKDFDATRTIWEFFKTHPRQ